MNKDLYEVIKDDSLTMLRHKETHKVVSYVHNSLSDTIYNRYSIDLDEISQYDTYLVLLEMLGVTLANDYVGHIIRLYLERALQAISCEG